MISCLGVIMIQRQVLASRPIATKKRTKRHATVLVSELVARVIDNLQFDASTYIYFLFDLFSL